MIGYSNDNTGFRVDLQMYKFKLIVSKLDLKSIS